MKMETQTNKPKWTKTKKKNPAAKPAIICFFVLLFIGALVALYLPLRPTYSEAEKRNLAKFPEFSFAALTDGSYFDGISTWYADTFPWREMFTNVNGKIKSFYGIGDSVSGELPVEPADDIPKPVVTKPGETVPTTQAPVTKEPIDEPIDEPVDDSLIQKLSSVLIVDDSGYEYYSFVKRTADRYAAAVSRTADSLSGTARVFDLVVPTSMDITLSDSVRKNINTSSQSDAIDYIYSVISSNCVKVKTYETLRAHRDEYVYFRTDHHWTALGAYYAYQEYTKAAGIKTAQLTDFNEKQFDNFVGAFYNDSGKNKALEKNPDTVYAYEPKGDVTLEYTDKSGKVIKWNVVTDVSNWSRGSKYNAFVGGDNPFTKIVNRGITDGSSCLVIKESFGNALIPFLTENYGTVYVVDYRYWKGNIPSFVKSNGVDDVMFLNNVSATRNGSLVSSLNSIS